MRKVLGLLCFLLLVGGLQAQSDGFARERRGKTAKAKDALEGKQPPALQVTGWLNTDKKLNLKDLRGKVVLLDFWGTW